MRVDYKLEKTLEVPSSLSLIELEVDLKFHSVDENAMIAQITISSVLFDFYYFA